LTAYTVSTAKFTIINFHCTV